MTSVFWELIHIGSFWIQNHFWPIFRSWDIKKTFYGICMFYQIFSQVCFADISAPKYRSWMVLNSKRTYAVLQMDDIGPLIWNNYFGFHEGSIWQGGGEVPLTEKQRTTLSNMFFFNFWPFRAEVVHPISRHFQLTKNLNHIYLSFKPKLQMFLCPLPPLSICYKYFRWLTVNFGFVI